MAETRDGIPVKKYRKARNIPGCMILLYRFQGFDHLYVSQMSSGEEKDDDRKDQGDRERHREGEEGDRHSEHDHLHIDDIHDEMMLDDP